MDWFWSYFLHWPQPNFITIVTKLQSIVCNIPAKKCRNDKAISRRSHIASPISTFISNLTLQIVSYTLPRPLFYTIHRRQPKGPDIRMPNGSMSLDCLKCALNQNYENYGDSVVMVVRHIQLWALKSVFQVQETTKKLYDTTLSL